MSSFAETNTPPTSFSISTLPSNTTFYRASFARPPSIPSDLFKGSFTAMKDGITRNPYAHHDSLSSYTKPNCKCEYSKKNDFSECIDCKQKSILQPQQIAQEEKLKKQIQQEDASHQDQHSALVHACGVTIECLLAFTFDHNCWDKPTWWVNRHIIKEATRHNRRRYMDLDEMKQYKRPATVFMSHCWKATWGDMVLAACHGARFGRVVWIDLFAVRQWPGNGADIDFRNVINKCDAFIVSVSPVDGLKKWMSHDKDRDAYLASDEGKAAKKGIPVFRLWCNVEIAAAYNKKIPIVIKGGQATKDDNNNTYKYDTKCVGILLNNLACMIDVESSECSSLEDYKREMEIVRCLEGGSKGVNALLAGVVAGAIVSIANNILEIDAFVCNEPESFLALNIPLGCEGETRVLAQEALSAACSGGRELIVKELLLKWSVQQDDDKDKEGETKRNDSMKKEKKGIVFHENDGRLYFVCINANGVGCRNSPVMDDRCSRKQVVFNHDCVVGTLTTDGQWICIVESQDEKQIGKFLPMTKPGDDIFFKRITTKIEWIELEDTKQQSWLLFLIDDSQVLWKASSGGHVGVVKMILEVVGINVNVDRFGSTPLYRASANGHLAIVKVLLEAGGNVNQARTTDGASPLYIASQNGNVDLVKVLLDADGNVNQATTIDGTTPLFVASQNGNIDTVKVLLAKGANVNQARTDSGGTPLFMASQQGNVDTVKVLIDAGGNVNQHGNKDATPLFIASNNGHIDTVRCLLQQPNIDIHKKTNNGLSPLDIATHKNHTAIVQLLKDAGATTFYRASFTRPPSISSDLFKSSSTAMEEGKSRNPFIHWKINRYHIPQDPCKCEYSKKSDFSLCIDCHEKSILQPQIAREEEWIKQVQEEDAAHEDQHMDLLHACGVTIEWLLAFTFDHKCWHRPTWWVNRHIIKEATRHNRRRYMDLDEMKQYKQPATVFMSHCWGAAWGDVVLAACHGARFGRVVWIDLFAVRQWPGNKADLDFRNLVNKCDAFIVSVSPVDGLKEILGNLGDCDAYLSSDEGKVDKKGIPVFRLWCNVEIAAAYNKKIPIVIKGGKATKDDNSNTYSYDTKCVGSLMDNLSNMVDVEASECSALEDYEREMKIVRSLEGGSDGVNALIAGVVLGGHKSIELNILEIDAFVCNEPESFHALSIPSGCEGKARLIAGKVLIAAGGGGRESIIKELLSKWSVKEDDNQNKEGETKRNDSMKKEKEMKRKWLIQLIDDSAVLFAASSGGHIGVVKMILEVVGINVNDDNNGNSPLYVASQKGNIDVVKVLIQAGGNVNKKNTHDGASPLCVASQNGNAATVKLLIDAGGNVNQAATTYGASPLCIASQHGNIAIVKVLIKASGNVNQARTTDGASPLWMASQNGHVAIVKVLIKAGGNVNQSRTDNGASPLLIATENANVVLVKVLIKAGGNVNQAADDGCSPLYIASRRGNIEIVKVLIEAGGNANQALTTDGTSPLFMASLTGHLEVVRLLLQQPNIDVNKGAEGCSPLWMASQNGHIDTVKVLIEAGVFVNQVRTTDGASPLFMASQNGYFDLVKVLTKAGGNINQAMTTDGASPLYIASYNGDIDTVKVLIEAGSNVNQHSNRNITPLIIASCNGHTEIVRLLLQQPNIDIHKKANSGHSSLDIATLKNHTQIIQYLKDAGAQLSHR